MMHRHLAEPRHGGTEFELEEAVIGLGKPAVGGEQRKSRRRDQKQAGELFLALDVGIGGHGVSLTGH